MRALYLISGLTFLLAACGSDDDKDETPPPQPPAPTVLTGVFLDSPVINIGFTTATQSGVTNGSGQFSYVEGEEVTFSIGDLLLPAAMASGTLTPLDLADTENVTNPTLVNMLRLLQSLDQDGNPDNGITITDTAIASASMVDFSQSIDDFAASSAVMTTLANAGLDSPLTALISTDDAVTHLNDQLLSNGINNGIAGTWKANDDENDLLLLMFFNDGTYVHMEVDESDTEEESGSEWGTYQRDATTNQLTVTQVFDNNGDTGLTDFVGDGSPFLYASVDGDVMTATIDENGNGAIDATLTFNRLPQDGIVGTWQVIDNDNELIAFNFMDNGQYVMIEVDASDAAEESGMEWGNYTIDAQTGQLTATQIFDNNSDVGLTDFTANATPKLYFNVVGNVLTATVDEDGDGVIDEVLLFERK